jgi:hypothetical protein
MKRRERKIKRKKKMVGNERGRIGEGKDDKEIEWIEPEGKIGRDKKERREREEVWERAVNGISCLGYVVVV